MFDKLWDGIAEVFAGRVTAQALAPAVAFWGGGVLALASRYGWQTLGNQLEGLNGVGWYVLPAVGGLLLLAGSTAAVSFLQLSTIRFLEGYWPWPFRRLRFALARWRQERWQAKEDRWQVLAAKKPKERSAEELAEFAGLDAELGRYPEDKRRWLPTRLGNVLRGAEDHSQVRYGLAMGVCWPRLWLLLPGDTREALTLARERLNGDARFFVWAGLFFVWTAWAWWPPAVGTGLLMIAYWAMLRAAGTYGDLLRAAFDLHRIGRTVKRKLAHGSPSTFFEGPPRKV
jgi:hypothetical protein